MRWRALVVLALMIGLSGAAVFAALAGARRSASALDRFHDAGQTLDVFLSADSTAPEPPGLLALLDGPLVESTNDLAFLLVDVDAVGVIFSPTSRRGLQIEQGVLLAGRRADPDNPDEVVLSELVARQLDLGVGDLFVAGSLSREQGDAFFNEGIEPTALDGPQLRLRVVGITRNGFDLNTEGLGLTLTTPAFWAKYGADIGIGSRSHMVRLIDEPDALERFTNGVADAYGGGEEHLPSINVGQGEDTIADSVSVITAALVAMALAIAVAGLLWSASATARHQRLAVADIDVLRALGSTARERRILLVGCSAPAILGGVALAPVLAVVLSPLFPVGTARHVDPDPGLHADVLVLLAGSIALALVLGLLAILAAVRLVSQSQRQVSASLRVPRLVDRAARRLRPAPGTGVRFALSAPPRSSATVRPALAGAIVGVAGLVTVAVIGASLHRLVHVPARWGTTWDVAVDAGSFVSADADTQGGASPEPDREALLADPDIDAAAIVLYDEQITINGVEAIAMTVDPLKGGMAPTVIEGRAPRAADEIALGSDTFRDVRVDLGTTVTVGSRSQAIKTYRIVGVIAFPTIGEPTAVATGASLTAQGGDRLRLGTGGADVGTSYVVLRWAPGVDHVEALTRLGIETSADASSGIAIGPTAPPEVNGLIDVQQFPLAVGVVLAVLGMIATSHALLVTVRRRRVELGLLSALGFVPAQRRAVIVGQATTITLTALVIGMPLGALVGRVVWSTIAESIGVATDASFPVTLLAIGAIGFVVLINMIAAFPARSARRLRVADALRSE